MADPESDPAGQPLPFRAFAEVGVLSAAFNPLVGRFIAAEKSYRADLAEAARVDQERLEFLAGLARDGKLRTAIDRRYTLEETGAALDYIGSRRARGKVIVTVN